MRIPGLRTGMMKNPVGFAVRAALNDKSGTKSPSTGRRSGRSTSTRSSSGYSSKIGKSSSSYSYSSKRSSLGSYSSGVSKSQPVSYADDEHNYSSFPNIFLDKGIIRAYGYTLSSARNKAISLAKANFNIKENNCKLTEMPCSPADSYKYGVEVTVDMESVKKDISADSKRYSLAGIEKTFNDFRMIHFSKGFQSYKAKIKENKERIEKAKKAIVYYKKNTEELNCLKEQSDCYLTEIRKLRECIDKCGFFSLSRKQKYMKELNRITVINQEIESLIKDLEDQTAKISNPDILKDIIDSLTQENKNLTERCDLVEEPYVYNYVKEEIIYARILDEYIISVLIKEETKKELLLEDFRINSFIMNHPEVNNDLPKPTVGYKGE